MPNQTCDCNRGLVNGVVCEKCNGTGLIEENPVETVVEKVKKVVKKK